MTDSPSLPVAWPRESAIPVRSRGSQAARQPLIWLLVLAGLGLVWAAGRLAGHQELAMGSPAERLYLGTGFHDQETRADGVPFRWTGPTADLRLPRVGPGPTRISLTVFDSAPVPRTLRLRLDGQAIYEGATQPGGGLQVLAVVATATTSTPHLALETASWQPPGDRRTLGVAVTHLAVDAPATALRARLNMAALLVAVLALVLAVAGRLTGGGTLAYRGALGVAATGGLAVFGFWGGLLAYGDGWLSNAAPAIGVLGLGAAGAIAAWPGTPGAGGARPAAAWGALALAAGLLLITLGRFNTGDAEGMYQVTAGLAEDGVPWQHKNHEWIKFGLGQPLATLPLYWLSRAAGRLAHADLEGLAHFGVALFNQVIIPTTALVLFLGARRRYGSQIALALAATWLLATPALAYARLAFAEPLSGLLILAAFLLLFEVSDIRYQVSGLVGLCLGLAVLVKPANAIYIPVPALYLVWRAYNAARQSDHRPRPAPRAPRPFVALGLGLLPGLLLTAGYNALRYGSPITFGYEAEGFTTSLPVGLYGLLASPGKGLIWYAPPLLLAPWGLAAAWRSGRPGLRAAAGALAAQAAIVLGFHALWSSWEGNIAWGPRLVLPLVPLLLWPLGMIAGRPAARWAWAGLAALGFLVAIPGALVDQFYYFDLHEVYGASTAAEAEMLFNPTWSPILAHWRFLLSGAREALVRPTLESLGLPAGWDTAVPVALAALALAALVAAVRAIPPAGGAGAPEVADG